MRSRLGAPKAITATAHKLAIIIYNMLKHGKAYVDRGADYYEQQYHAAMVRRTSSNGRGSSALNCSKRPPCLPLRPPNRNFVVPDHRHFPSVAMGEPLPLCPQPKNRLDYPPTYTVSTPKFLIPAFASTETTPTMDRTRPPGRHLLRGSSLGAP